VPGGLIGVGTLMDPTLTRADRLVGQVRHARGAHCGPRSTCASPTPQVLGHKGDLPDVFVEVEISFYLLKRLLGVKTAEGGKAAKVRRGASWASRPQRAARRQR